MAHDDIPNVAQRHSASIPIVSSIPFHTLLRPVALPKLSISLFGLVFLLLLDANPFLPRATAQELRAQGLQFLSADRYASIPLASPPLSGPLPEKIDLSSDFPAPGSQGEQASCVGWAVGYALKSYQEARQHSWIPNTNDRIFSPSFIYNQIKQSPDCHSGTFLVDALDLLAEKGNVPITLFPYDSTNCVQTPNEAIEQQAHQYRIAAWSRVNVQSPMAVKAHLAAGFPVAIGMAVHENFHTFTGTSNYDRLIGRITGGHAMVVVGYDDSRKAFRLINSWGEDWGDSGYVWVSYDAFINTVKEGYATQDIVVPTPNPVRPSPIVVDPLPPVPRPPVSSKAISTWIRKLGIYDLGTPADRLLSDSLTTDSSIAMKSDRVEVTHPLEHSLYDKVVYILKGGSVSEIYILGKTVNVKDVSMRGDSCPANSGCWWGNKVAGAGQICMGRVQSAVKDIFRSTFLSANEVQYYPDSPSFEGSFAPYVYFPGFLYSADSSRVYVYAGIKGRYEHVDEYRRKVTFHENESCFPLIWVTNKNS